MLTGKTYAKFIYNKLINISSLLFKHKDFEYCDALSYILKQWKFTFQKKSQVRAKTHSPDKSRSLIKFLSGSGGWLGMVTLGMGYLGRSVMRLKVVSSAWVVMAVGNQIERQQVGMERAQAQDRLRTGDTSMEGMRCCVPYEV